MTPAWLRLMIALDIACQAPWRDGLVGVTMSSRIGTAVAHGHRWGRIAQWLLETAYPLCWIFGFEHCKGAVKHDIERAQAAIASLTDPVVTKWLNEGK